MKTADLEGFELNYWVAKAEGLTINKSGRAMWISTEGVSSYLTEHGNNSYSPSTCWAQGGPLIEKWNLDLDSGSAGCYLAGRYAIYEGFWGGVGDTPLQAICRAVVRAAFGDEVEEVLP
jgi:hypothetical protein